MEVSSKSTDKLGIICNAIERKILADEELKKKVIKINIDWKSIATGDGLMACPSLEVEFKQ